MENERRAFLKTSVVAMAGWVFIPVTPAAGRAVRKVWIPIKPLVEGDIGPAGDLAG
ncbi:MAG: hypothetical protein ISR64_11255 [Deltaproteobacteria bacterium]|nr:hypothetical protein [Deltaproteobacteria bacterium]